MWFSSIFFVIGFSAFLINNGYASPVMVESNEFLKFIAFIGVKLKLTDENGQWEIIKEVVGIGAVIGSNSILTTQEYLKWDGQQDMTYFILLGTHNFDQGGTEIPIEETIVVPQTSNPGAHTFHLLKFATPLTNIHKVVKMVLKTDEFQLHAPYGRTVGMVGIFQRESIRLGVTNETIKANQECKELLDINPKIDKRYERTGSHFCLVTKNWRRVDCKSHIGTIVFHKTTAGTYYLIGIKSAVHQSCSRVPYLIQFQWVSHVASWLESNK